eukprot:412631_1
MSKLIMLTFSNFPRSRLIQKCISLSFRYCSNETEEWREIPGFYRYQISSFGNLKSKRFNKLLKINYDRMKRYNSVCAMKMLNDQGNSMNVSTARMALSVFHPMENNEKHFATHLDGNKYNNKLSNLQWNKCKKVNSNANSKIGNSSSIKLQSNVNGILQLKSAVGCKQYLESIGINTSTSTISKLCINQQEKFGFKFLFTDESKYQLRVSNLEGEIWKLFAETTRGTQYWVSNKARIKSVKCNGREKLLETHWCNGYLRLESFFFSNLKCLHKE